MQNNNIKMQQHLMMIQKSTNKNKSQSLRNLILLLSTSFCVTYYILVSTQLLATPKQILQHLNNNYSSKLSSLQEHYSSTTIEHVVFGIASSGDSWHKRKQYTKLWWNNKTMKGCVFVDKTPMENDNDSSSLPPLCVSEDTSRFKYSYRGGLRSAIRVARVLKETVALNHSGVRWYVFGDDDTVFLPENLVKTLSKYDDRLWYYIGSNSESYKQKWFFGFDMAYGGAGFAISGSLAKVLAKVFDECIQRYPHVYGSDGRVYSCVTELGLALTLEPGFHQVDLRRNAFGLLASHPLTPLVSLHHPDYIDPIFPNINTTRAKSLEHLFQAVNFDSQRILQQTVCYHKRFSWTISVSWGYAVQVYQHPMLLTDVLRVQGTFKHWSGGDVLSPLYTFNTRGFHPHPCKRPTIFYLQDLSYANNSKLNGSIISNYNKYFQNCSYDEASPRRLEMIKVFSNKLELDIKQLLSPRRQCCDVLNSSASNIIEIGIRECKDDELIYMH